MQGIELKIPPPIVALLIAIATWWIAQATPAVKLTDNARLSATIISALTGIAFVVAGSASFRRAGTTVNPMKPEMTSSLVTSGIYRVTRNPMYVGLSIILVAFAIFLSSGWALIGPITNVLYLNRFQIIPEERALAAMFGADYTSYVARVRRWI